MAESVIAADGEAGGEAGGDADCDADCDVDGEADGAGEEAANDASARPKDPTARQVSTALARAIRSLRIRPPVQVNGANLARSVRVGHHRRSGCGYTSPRPGSPTGSGAGPVVFRTTRAGCSRWRTGVVRPCRSRSSTASTASRPIAARGWSTV